MTDDLPFDFIESDRLYPSHLDNDSDIHSNYNFNESFSSDIDSESSTRDNTYLSGNQLSYYIVANDPKKACIQQIKAKFKEYLTKDTMFTYLVLSKSSYISYEMKNFHSKDFTLVSKKVKIEMKQLFIPTIFHKNKLLNPNKTKLFLNKYSFSKSSKIN